MAEHIRVLIADDDWTIRDGYTAYFSLADDIEVIGTAGNGREALELIDDPTTDNVDIVLSDIHMPELDGPGLLAELRRRIDAPATIAITALDTDESLVQMITGGAVGYVLKSAPPAQLIDAVRDGYHGGTALSPECLSRLVAYVPPVSPSSSPVLRQVEALGPTERAILDELCTGKSNAEIAEVTFFAESTVKKVVSRLIRRFEVDSRLRLATEVLNARRANGRN
ncbi:DNA-binding response regulator [Corynebacterium yudongzhengii]|uniref:DNA-binding response regulator n=1 Tax=Corynebacterium yudongzhengii TaxID=2080740 RepID=A0A2U1T426_9CORY|nr:response regulator transcription factor [Corynebacterium yudongzhengii]AWB82840.1 DNA-binding response regulator [Corynebacterium yudongzhengii]PWC00757.1 DNA-binding response regulator [Corynebacterium yudongzhengii]